MTVKQQLLRDMQLGNKMLFTELLDSNQTCNRYLIICDEDIDAITNLFDENLYGHWGDFVMTTIHSWGDYHE